MRSTSLRAVLLAVITSVVVLTPAPAQAVPQAAARTPLPSDRLHFGLANSPGTDLDWLAASGTPWRYRYQYLAGGVNTGGAAGDPCGANAGWQTWDSPAGQFATLYINDSVARSAIPVFTYYEIVQSNPSPGSESAELTKISTLCTMQAYWADFTVLMQKIGAYGGQVVVHVEPDFWGFMEHESADPTTLSAVVASSGNPDLAGLPNTVAGMGLAFLKLRDKYAPNALLGIHASSWGSGVDIGSDQRSTVDPNAEADKVASFLNKAGIVGNINGITPWDLVFNDVADHDSGFSGNWWDRNNILFPNFARWLAFMGRLHADTGLPLVEWQVPVGNQYFQTMNNTDGHYQDNRAEYFLAHPSDLTAAGIVAVLFGKANGGQTTYTDFKGDGITNPAPVASWQCNLCNNHVSAVADDDGGFLRMAVGAYYAGTAPCASAVMSANPASQQSVGGTVMVGAASSGCTNPRYQFWTQAPGGSWTIAQAYSASTTFSWATTGLTAGLYHLSAWVRDAASSAAYDAFAPGIPYTLLGTTCASVGAAAAPASPQAAGTVVSITATSGCPNPRYEFWIQAPGGSWTIAQAYSSGNTFNWATAGLSAGIYKYSVWVRDATSAAAYDSYFPGTAYTLTTITCTGVTASATPASPQDAGTMITLSATASGCPNPRYEFWVQAPGGSWTVVQAYSSGNSFAWNTVPPAGIYKYSVWVRDAASAAAYDSYFPGTTFTLTTTPCSGVTASATPASPQTAGTAITITATASGCPNPRFEFWIQAPGGGWTIAHAYSNSNSFSWNTMPLAGVYKYSVWVRDASSGASYDTYFPGTSYRLT